jgi:hypothetical protein
MLVDTGILGFGLNFFEIFREMSKMCPNLSGYKLRSSNFHEFSFADFEVRGGLFSERKSLTI